MQITLKHGCAEGIVDTLGGELISYKRDGKEYIWVGDGAYWTGHAPVLFPIVGALKDDKVEIDGGSYSMKKHGFARKTEFKLNYAKDGKAEFQLDWSDETLKMYPYKFRLIITHEIDCCGFSTTYKVVNTDEKKIMFTVGGHAGFNIGNIEEWKLIFEKAEDAPLYYTDEKSLCDDSLKLEKKLTGTDFDLIYSDYDVDALVVKDLSSRKVKLVNKNDGKAIDFDFTGFDVLGIWTPPHKKAPFMCLEPWNGIPAYKNETGKFEDKPYAVSVEPANEYSVGYKVRID